MHEREHQGTFAEGLETEDDHAESGPNRRFSEGLEGPPNHRKEHEGSFARGLGEASAPPRTKAKRRFSEGLEENDRAEDRARTFEKARWD
jgi:hypothetical protein